MYKLDPTSIAWKAIQQARAQGNLRIDVAGFDSVADEYKFIKVAFQSIAEAIE